jgi:hypothetical protein
MSIASKT